MFCMIKRIKKIASSILKKNTIDFQIVLSDNEFLVERITDYAIPAYLYFDFERIKEDTLGFVNAMHIDDSIFNYRYSPSCKTPNIYSSAYACMIFSMYGELDQLSPFEKQNWAQHFSSFQNEKDGLFYDLSIGNESYDNSDWWGARHLALHLINVFIALNARPQYPFYFLNEYKSAKFLKNWLDQQNWQGKFLQSDIDNKIMNIVGALQYQRDFWQDEKAGESISFIQSYLMDKINPLSGMWGYFNMYNKDELSRMVQFAYHLFPMYFYDSLDIGNKDKIIDLTLQTQNKYGGFGVKLNSSACEDIDSIDILIRFSKLTTYKKIEINLALKRAFIWVLSNQNEDGGYVFRRNEPFLYGHEQMYSGKNESALFPTWFRTLAIAYLANYFGIANYCMVKSPGYEY